MGINRLSCIRKPTTCTYKYHLSQGRLTVGWINRGRERRIGE